MVCRGGAALVLAMVVVALTAGGHTVEARRYYDGMLRIVPSGAYPFRGRLEVLHHYRWGTVCNDYFTHRSANVACRQMGLPGGWRVGHYNHNGLCRHMDGRYMCGRRWIWMDNVWCRGWERRLKDCYRWPWGWHNCHHSEDVMIHCRSPPLWNIEWGFEDEPDKSPYISGVISYYVLFMKRTATPNFFSHCWPMWRAHKKLKIRIYTDDYPEMESPDHLGDTHLNWSWLYGFLQKPWWNPYVYFYIRGQHCDLERIRTLACGKHFEIPPDIRKSYCWERQPRMPEGYSLLQHTASTVPLHQPYVNPIALDHEVSQLESLVDAAHVPQTTASHQNTTAPSPSLSPDHLAAGDDAPFAVPPNLNHTLLAVHDAVLESLRGGELWEELGVRPPLA